MVIIRCLTDCVAAFKYIRPSNSREMEFGMVATPVRTLSILTLTGGWQG